MVLKNHIRYSSRDEASTASGFHPKHALSLNRSDDQQDAVDLFRNICRSPCLSSTPIIGFCVELVRLESVLQSSASSTSFSASGQPCFLFLPFYPICTSFILRTVIQNIYTMQANEPAIEFETADVASISHIENPDGFLNTRNVANGGDGLIVNGRNDDTRSAPSQSAKSPSKWSNP